MQGSQLDGLFISPAQGHPLLEPANRAMTAGAAKRGRGITQATVLRPGSGNPRLSSPVWTVPLLIGLRGRWAAPVQGGTTKVALRHHDLKHVGFHQR